MELLINFGIGAVAGTVLATLIIFNKNVKNKNKKNEEKPTE